MSLMASFSDFYKFINENINEDTTRLRLAVNRDKFDFDVNLAITQIECRKKYKAKFGDLLQNDKFIFPDHISAEQASHIAVAKFHAELVGINKKVLDMTAGLGIDAIEIAINGNQVTAVELNPLKTETLKQNVECLGIHDMKVVNSDSVEFILKSQETYDLIFIDPARRNNADKRLYNFHDCSPDVIDLQSELLRHTSKILIKGSPLLDISQTIKDFPKTCSIRVIGVKGECKEVLIEIDGNIIQNEGITLEAINLDINGEILSYFSTKSDFKSKKDCEIIYATEDQLIPGTYLLEPSAMVMKLAPWSEICHRFNSRKLGKSSNLFLSEIQPQNFPGRVTVLQSIIKKQDRKSFLGSSATVVSKNYPLSADDLRKSLRLKEGTENFIYASRIGEKPVLLHSKPVTC